MLNLPTPVDDGLTIPVVREWAKHKHHFLLRYIDAFTTAMKRKKWTGLHYVDLFAGAGVSRIESSGALEWGSPLIAAQARYPFTRLHLCEKDGKNVAALRRRVVQIRGREVDQIVQGDANTRVTEIVAEIPRGSLALAFLDPYGLHLDYETLRSLSAIRADLVIYFPDALDIRRNYISYYWDNPKSKLDSAFGRDSNWREAIRSIPESRRMRVLLDLYEEQIKKLGYAYFEEEPIPSERARLYWLVFCSRVELGARIWRRIAAKKPGGQRTFDFSD